MRIGILGTASIAYQRFLPSLTKCKDAEFVGIASRDFEKTKKFTEAFGGKGYGSYEEMLEDPSIDAVYIPLPPSLHFEWGKKALLHGKHVLMEKPFTTNEKDTKELLDLAKEKGLIVHENYMFLYHSQLQKIKEILKEGTLGEIRLFRMAFAFPKRAEGDFRYTKELGGGALLDCGGYPVRLALELLGDSAKVVQAKLVMPKEYDVDLYGNAVLENDEGMIAQIFFGMDNSYQCELEVMGSEGYLKASRIFTAGPDLRPPVQTLLKGQDLGVPFLEDDHFLHSIETFLQGGNAEHVQRQAALVEEIKRMGSKE